ncbi:GrpB family protein [Candidatus Bathyarchaeota archaeon]|nr:GrpB family protein [Candidatus Bathyarchaeota archaeon]
MSGPVEVVDYDPRWPKLYEEAKRHILEAMGDKIVRIEHIGSTAVPNTGAKPVIDIMVGLNRLSDVGKCNEPLQRIGFEYQPEHEASMPERRFFRRGNPPKEQHYHLHIVELTSDFWKRHLLFRDYLRTHPKGAEDYYELKKRLADKYGSDREGYAEAKTSFVESIVAKAHATRDRQELARAST